MKLSYLFFLFFELLGVFLSMGRVQLLFRCTLFSTPVKERVLTDSHEWILQIKRAIELKVFLSAEKLVVAEMS